MWYLFRKLFGYDIFISYSRADATPYAQALCKTLSAHYAVFLDTQEMPAGQVLDRRLKQALSRSSAFIPIISAKAKHSKFVEEEIEYFSQLKRPVLPISINDEIRTPNWERVQKFRWIDETAAALSAGQPGKTVIKDIQGFFDFTRRIMVRAFTVASVTLLILVATGFAYLQKQVADAADAQRIVEESSKLVANAYRHRFSDPISAFASAYQGDRTRPSDESQQALQDAHAVLLERRAIAIQEQSLVSPQGFSFSSQTGQGLLYTKLSQDGENVLFHPDADPSAFVTAAKNPDGGHVQLSQWMIDNRTPSHSGDFPLIDAVTDIDYLGFSSDGVYLLAIDDTCSVHLWDYSSKGHLLTRPAGDLSCASTQAAIHVQQEQ